MASTQGILGSVVYFVVKKSRWPCLDSTQPCLCSTISLGYWVIRTGGSWALSRYNGRWSQRVWALCPPHTHSGCYVTVSLCKNKEARRQERKCSPWGHRTRFHAYMSPPWGCTWQDVYILPQVPHSYYHNLHHRLRPHQMPRCDHLVSLKKKVQGWLESWLKRLKIQDCLEGGHFCSLINLLLD